MRFVTKSERPTNPASENAKFAMPNRDIVDLLRSSALPAPFNDEVLLEDCLEDVETMRLVLEEFRTNGPRRIERVAQCVPAGNLDALVAAARDLKTSANALSAIRLRDLAGALEKSCRVVGRECQDRLVKQLRAEMNRCLEYITLVVAATCIGAN